MQQSPVILSIGLGLSALLSTYLASHARTHSRATGAREAGFLLLCVALYSLGYAVEILLTDVEKILMVINLEYSGIVFLAPLLMLLVLHIVHGKPASKVFTAGLLIIPCLTLLIVCTQKHHNLYYINPRVVTSGFFPALTFERGIWYYVHVVFEQFCALIAIILLVRHAIHLEKRQKKQIIMIIVGSLVPTICGIVYYLGFIPNNLDTGPFSFTITGIIFSIAVFKMGFLELVPAARELAMDAINDALIVVDEDQILQDYNQAARDLPGMGAIRIGDSLISNDTIGEQLQPLLDKETQQIEFAMDTRSTGKRIYQACAYQVGNNQKQPSGMAILIRDITENTVLMKKLQYQANVDGLTGILNHRELMQQGEKEIELSCSSGMPLGIILIDLDHFKQINDKYGHLVGDEVLKGVVTCLRSGLRSVDILGRYGGEEFIILLPGVGIKTSLVVAERLRKEIQDCDFLISEKKIKLTASFGVYAYEDAEGQENTKLKALIDAADRALYQAKVKGRNKVAYI